MSKRKQISDQDAGHRKRATTPVPRNTTQETALAFRISNIPAGVNPCLFRQFLDRMPYDTSLSGAVGDQQNVLGWSFARSAASVDSERYRTITVTFRSIPDQFRFPETFHSVTLIENSPPVIVDKHFYGLTPLNFAKKPTVEYGYPGPSMRVPLIDLALLL